MRTVEWSARHAYETRISNSASVRTCIFKWLNMHESTTTTTKNGKISKLALFIVSETKLGTDVSKWVYVSCNWQRLLDVDIKIMRSTIVAQLAHVRVRVCLCTMCIKVAKTITKRNTQPKTNEYAIVQCIQHTNTNKWDDQMTIVNHKLRSVYYRDHVHVLLALIGHKSVCIITRWWAQNGMISRANKPTSENRLSIV